MAFEQVTKERGSTDIRISLRRSIGIGVSKAAVETHFEDVSTVALYYDDEQNLLGIEPTPDGDDQSDFALTRTHETGTITPHTFLRDHGLVPQVTTYYTTEWDDDRGMLVADLTDVTGTHGTIEEQSATAANTPPDPDRTDVTDGEDVLEYEAQMRRKRGLPPLDSNDTENAEPEADDHDDEAPTGLDALMPTETDGEGDD